MGINRKPPKRSWYGENYTSTLPESIDIPGYDGKYYVTQDGNVWHRFKTKPAYQMHGVLKNGKREYKLTKDRKTTLRTAAWIMKKTYFSYLPKGYCLKHINGILEDNSVINLKPMSREEIGKANYRSKKARCILRCDPVSGEVLEIFMSTRDVEKKRYISRQTVSNACNNQNKKHPGIAPDGFLYRWDSDCYY